MSWIVGDAYLFERSGQDKVERTPLWGGDLVRTKQKTGTRPLSWDSPRHQVSYLNQGNVPGLPAPDQAYPPARWPTRPWHEQPGGQPFPSYVEAHRFTPEQLAHLRRNVQPAGPYTGSTVGVTVDSGFVPSTEQAWELASDILPRDTLQRKATDMKYSEDQLDALSLLKHKGSSAFAGLDDLGATSEIKQEAKRVAKRVFDGLPPLPDPKPGTLERIFDFAENVATNFLSQREVPRVQQQIVQAQASGNLEAARRRTEELRQIRRLQQQSIRESEIARLSGPSPWVIGGLLAVGAGILYFTMKD